MTQEHLTDRQIEAYRRRAIDPGERQTFDRHLAACDACLRRVVNTAHTHVAFAALTEAFLPSADEEPFHLSRAELKRYAEGSLDQADRIIFESHLEDCLECSGGARELQSRQPRYAPRTVWERFTGFWPRLPSLRPVQAGAVAAVCICLLLGMFLIQSRLSDRKNQPAQTQVATDAPTEHSQPAAPSRDDLADNQAQAETASRGDENANSEAAGGNSTPQQAELQAVPKSVASLIDGGVEVALDAQGNLKGLEALDSSIQREVKTALSGGDMKRPGVLDELSASRITLLDQSANVLPFALLNPAGVVVANDRPAFQWQQLSGATNYTVSVYDSNFNRVLRSEPQSATLWSPPTTLPRGKTYFWEVTALRDGQAITSPVAPAPRAQFKILEAEKAGEINRVKRERPNSHLVLGILYVRAGLLEDAEREFRELARANPRSPLAAKLLRRVQSWKKQ